MASAVEDFDDEYGDFDDFDDDDHGVSGFVVLLVIMAMLIAFLFIVWFAYNKGIRQGALQQTPYVAADPEPVKTAALPAVTSDAITDNNNREVYDRFDGKQPVTTETLAAGPEEPLVNDDVDQIGGILASEATQVANDRFSAPSATEVPGVTGSNRDSTGTQVKLTTPGRSEDADPLGSVINKALTEPDADTSASRGTISPTPASVTTTSTTPTRAAAPTGSHVVQVGAFRSEGEADQFWDRLNKRYGSDLAGKAKDIERADLGAKGIYYRLRIGYFDGSTAAKSYCSDLKAKGQDCLAKSR